MERLQQVALIIASLPQREAADLLVRLPEDVVERIGRFTPCVVTIDRQQQERLATELAQAIRGRGTHPIQDVNNSDAIPWSIAKYALSQMNLGCLTAILVAEMPQTVAVILQALEIDRAADVLAQLPTHQQMEVIRRMSCGCQMDPKLHNELIGCILSDGSPDTRDQTQGLDTIVRILLRLDHATEQALLENLRSEQPEIVDRLLQVKLILEDLADLEAPSGVPRDDLVDEVLKLHAQDPNACHQPVSGIPRAA